MHSPMHTHTCTLLTILPSISTLLGAVTEFLPVPACEIGSSPILNVTDAVRSVSGPRPEMAPGLRLARLHRKELSLARGLRQCRACV
eukprot:1126654-Rhodomonas_salina.1